MAVVLTVTAPGPAALAELWARLGGHHAHVDIVGDDISIHVDLTPQPEPAPQVEGEACEPVDSFTILDRDLVRVEPDPEPEADEDLVDQLAPIDPGADDQEPEPEATAPEGPTLRDRVLATINGHPDRTFTLAQVYEHLEGENQGSVAASVQWLVAHDRIRRVARGEYQALDRSAVHDARRRAAAEAM